MTLTPVHRPGSTTSSIKDVSSSITVGGTAQVLVAEQTHRRYLLVQNTSGGDLWIDFTATAVAASPSIRLQSGDTYVMEGTSVCGDAVSIFGATTGQTFTAKVM